ncbi:hypothetical protein CDD82_1218 [Ophiocordyceps australis]|uniref:Mitochondrial division protein 1 n=1 Tax=Ophiocordyceps australis TaxID=1399860 RepID=A0A2C5ZPK2_9HYPO|nr:hypothetical protein CDD82_1218 [Ophiocordyceps australis]
MLLSEPTVQPRLNLNWPWSSSKRLKLLDSLAMDSPDELAGTGSPPPVKPKRLKIRSAILKSCAASPASRLASHRKQAASPFRSSFPTSSVMDSRHSSPSSSSHIEAPPRSRHSSGSRHGSRASNPSSRSASHSASPTHSPPRSRSRSRSHSSSSSHSHDSSDGGSRSDSNSYSQYPHASQPTPPTEPLRPDYRLRLVLHGHTKPVSQVRISPDGYFIASASADGTIKIWNALTGAHLDTLVGHMAGVGCLAWSPDSKVVASGSDDKAIRLWDRVTGRPKTSATAPKPAGGRRDTCTLRGHHNYIHCLAFSPKGNILASGSYDEAVFLWDVRVGRLMRSLPAHSDPVCGIGFCCDGTLVVSCSTDGLIRIWDTSTGQCLRTLVHEDNPAVTNVCFSPNGRFVLSSNLDNCVRLWDFVSGSVKKTYQGHGNEKYAIGSCFAILHGEPFIVSASEEGDVIVWDVQNKQIVQRVPGHGGVVCFWVDVNATNEGAMDMDKADKNGVAGGVDEDVATKDDVVMEEAS